VFVYSVVCSRAHYVVAENLMVGVNAQSFASVTDNILTLTQLLDCSVIFGFRLEGFGALRNETFSVVLF